MWVSLLLPICAFFKVSTLACHPFSLSPRGQVHQGDVKKRCRITETSDVNTSDILKFLTPCAPSQLGTVGSMSDVGGIYVFVSVNNSGILTRNMPKLAFFCSFILPNSPRRSGMK